MDKKTALLVFAAVTGCLAALSGQYVIFKQEDKIEEYKKYTEALVEGIVEYEPYVPEDVVQRIRENISFEIIAQKFDK